MKQKLAPLSSGFCLVSILGVIFSSYYVMNWNPTWGVAFTIIFMCMFIASLRSMRWANPDAQLKLK